MKNILRTVMAVLVFSFGFSDLHSKGGGGFSSGGGKSSSSSSSGGKSWGSSSSTKPSYSSGSSTSKTTPSSSWGSSSSNKTTPSSKASSSLAQKQAATPVKPKSEYVADFKAKNAAQYSNKFAAEPATRPSYIPPSTSVDGRNYNITYNSGFGGYGYMNALGTFILFDAVTHAATMSYQRDLSYYNGQVVVVGHGFFYYFFMTLLFVALIFVVIAFIK